MKSSMLLDYFDFTYEEENSFLLSRGTHIVGKYFEDIGNNKREWKMIYICNSGYLLYGDHSREEISPNKLKLLLGSILMITKEKDCFYY